jgi:DNA-binding transcriptional ArsR family regulator
VNVVVNYSPQPSLDRVLSALAAPIRRETVERLRLGELPIGALAAPHSISMPAFMKHIDVLERAGVVRTEKRGRVRYCQLRSEPLEAVDGWLGRFRGLWDERFDRLEDVLRAEGPHAGETQ